MTAAEIHWMGWNESPWRTQPELGSSLVGLSDRLLNAGLEYERLESLLETQLPQIASEFSARWVGILQRQPQWSVVAEFGRHAPEPLPVELAEDTLDRGSSGRLDLGAASIITHPLQNALPDSILMLSGRDLTADDHAGVIAAGHALELAMAVCHRNQTQSNAIERLRQALQVVARFTTEQETRPLLERIAEEATTFLDCDRATIFLWDRDRKQATGCPALGCEDNILTVPDAAGIVGETLQTGRSVLVSDAYSDPRFNREVDLASGYRTRNLLCVPLNDPGGQRIGAFEVINKLDGPFDEHDEEALKVFGVHAAVALKNLENRQQLQRSRDRLNEQIRGQVEIVGESPAIKALRATIDRLATTDLPVLLLGESGTGKEVAAHCLHYLGARSDQPFVAVNCAALTETLLESELFGHEQGAFTDARETRPGKFELADGGTLFLDEVGDMSPGGQAKLLRVLEQKVITRVGGVAPIPIDVRVVAATNAKLIEAVREKRFREDLYYRLSVVALELPPLRDRPEDILPLAEFFLDRFAVQARRVGLKLSAAARRRLQAHAWPGNVRELRNLMERVAFLCQQDRVEPDDLAFAISADPTSGFEPSESFGLDQATKQFQREFIRRAIKRVDGNMSDAARLLSLHRSNLYRKMKQLEMTEGGADNASD